MIFQKDVFVRISIGLCTYKRTHLVETLKSIFEQAIPTNVEVIEIIVVDNDEACSGKALVESLDVPAGTELVYISEPKKNISVARNAFLNSAKGDWLAVVDDDEKAKPYWLASFVEAANAAPVNTAAFFGPIESIYTQNCPEWIRVGGFFDRPEKPDKFKLNSGATGNSFMNLNIIRKLGMQFSEEFGLTGGEDSDFFYRLNQRGYYLQWVWGAVVQEIIEEHRLNEAFLCQRAQRVGETFSRYRYRNPLIQKPLSEQLIYKCKSWFIWILSSLFAAVLMYSADRSPKAKARQIFWKLRALDAKGKLKGLKSNTFVQIYNQ